MDGWICTDCDRMFARNGQGHDCSPGLSLEEYFETGPAHERPIYDEVMRRFASIGPVHADAVSVGIFLKNPRKFAELRTRTKWVAIGFGLRRRATHPTITRKVVEHAGRHWHVANVATADQIDDALIDLLAEAYHDD
ncbi:MAG: DUF5655 domain-containing protein [Actinomycetota bacterium]